MHICIVGTGAAGWISAFTLQKLNFITKITIIGSPSIPTIGVGESTTLSFKRFVNNLFPNDKDYYKFLVDIDAAIKHGVFYKNWSNQNFLHAFVGCKENNLFGYKLGSVPPNMDANYFMVPLYDKVIKENKFVGEHLNYTFHFDANKFIKALEERSKLIPKINHIKDTIINSVFDNDKIQYLVLKNNENISADYYVNCVGQTAFSQKIFREEYESYSDILLTDKALFYPLKYTDKPKQFHPYTVAKTMKYGWRWITPTWSRIGTGYVYSSKYISTDEAINEFVNDIGDTSIVPFETDFFPRKIKEVYKPNYCSLGMAAGFLEPLDAPGLAMTNSFLTKLEDILRNKWFKLSQIDLNVINNLHSEMYDFWASFILHQYKTATRNDTNFWKDHKQVEFSYYEKIIDNFFNPIVENDSVVYPNKNILYVEPFMFYNTAVGKGHRWNTQGLIHDPVFTTNENEEYVNHFDWFSKVHKLYG